MDKFNYGDRVVCDGFGENIGTVLIVPSMYNDFELYGVAFDDKISFGHDLRLSDSNIPVCENGHGLFLDEYRLKIIDEISVSQDDFDSMFE